MKKRKLKKKPLIFLLILLVIGIVGATIAFYSSEERIIKNFKANTYKVGIEEEWDGTFGTKKVSFVNKEEDGAPVLLRFYYEESWKKTIELDGETIEWSINNIYQDSETGEWKDAVTTNWVENFNVIFHRDNDGWYYYDKVLDSGEAVQILESISLNGTAEERTNLEGYTYNLNFSMEAIQATPSAALRIWGIELGIEGSDVEWPQEIT